MFAIRVPLVEPRHNNAWVMLGYGQRVVAGGEKFAPPVFSIVDAATGHPLNSSAGSSLFRASVLSLSFRCRRYAEGSFFIDVLPVSFAVETNVKWTNAGHELQRQPPSATREHGFGIAKPGQ